MVPNKGPRPRKNKKPQTSQNQMITFHQIQIFPVRGFEYLTLRIANSQECLSCSRLLLLKNVKISEDALKKINDLAAGKIIASDSLKVSVNEIESLSLKMSFKLKSISETGIELEAGAYVARGTKVRRSYEGVDCV